LPFTSYYEQIIILKTDHKIDQDYSTASFLHILAHSCTFLHILAHSCTFLHVFIRIFILLYFSFWFVRFFDFFCLFAHSFYPAPCFTSNFNLYAWHLLFYKLLHFTRFLPILFLHIRFKAFYFMRLVVLFAVCFISHILSCTFLFWRILFHMLNISSFDQF